MGVCGSGQSKPTKQTKSSAKNQSSLPCTTSKEGIVEDIKTSNKYEKVISKLLASRGSLEIPNDLQWFPKGHGHIKAKKLFEWKQEIGHGVTGIVYAAKFKGRTCAVKKIQVEFVFYVNIITVELCYIFYTI